MVAGPRPVPWSKTTVAKKAKKRSMFMEVLKIEPAKDLVHLSVMDNDPVTGVRPTVDTELLEFTLPLSQFERLMDDFKKAFASKAYKQAFAKS